MTVVNMLPRLEASRTVGEFVTPPLDSSRHSPSTLRASIPRFSRVFSRHRNLASPMPSPVILPIFRRGLYCEQESFRVFVTYCADYAVVRRLFQFEDVGLSAEPPRPGRMGVGV